MFGEAISTAVPLGVDPVTADDVVWHPDRGEWVALEPCTRPAGVLPDDLERLAPGAELAGILERFDADAAAGYDLVEAKAALARLASWVAAKDADALSALAARAEMRPDETGYRSVNPVTNTAVAVAGRCQLTARQAENEVGHALQLVEDFPDTHAALEAGLIDLRRARVFTDELGGQEPAVRARVEAAALPKAPLLDSVALRKLIKRLLHELAPVETAERQRAARDRRYVAITSASNGMAFVEALLPAEHATALDTALNVAATDARRADAAAGLPARTSDQRRADALSDLGWAALTACADPATSGHALTMDADAAGRTAATGPAAGANSPAATSPAADGAAANGAAAAKGGTTSRRRPIGVHVTVPFATLFGLGDEPGELDGYGPIAADVTRLLATEGVWTWLRTDPGSGQLLDLGRTKYRPTKALAEFIAARDRTCRAPGCHSPARTADVDHIVAFAAGGTTTADNLHALCPTHHRLKHHGHWRVERQPDGTTEWTDPTGHQHRKPPERPG